VVREGAVPGRACWERSQATRINISPRGGRCQSVGREWFGPVKIFWRAAVLPRWLRKLGLCVLIAAGVVYVLAKVVAMLAPVVLAIAAALLLAALFEPLVEWLHGRGTPRWLAALIAVVGGIAVVAQLSAATGPTGPAAPAGRR
jgi:hypothetical protein